MKFYCRTILYVFWGLILINTSAFANDDLIPPQLKDWQAWVLKDSPFMTCPVVHNSSTPEHRCIWTSSTQLKANEKGLSFTIKTQLYNDAWLDLPGEHQYWPSSVYITSVAENAKHNSRLKKQDLAIRMGRFSPQAYINKGKHLIEGFIPWSKIPQSIRMPKNSGLINVKVQGETLIQAEIDKNQQLWLQKNSLTNETNTTDSIKLQVFRLIKDDNPTILITKLSLDVSGKAREIQTGQLLLDNFIALSLSSDLPSRLEENKALSIQVKPGHWQIELKARHQGPLTQLSYTKKDDLWPSSELWSFQANRSLRTVQIKNAQAVDPRQSNTPSQWAEFPTYRVESGQVMQFEESQRGDPNPEADKLNLNRNIYLDFDSSHFTIVDHISGKINQSWRLDTEPSYHLGKVTINDQAQLLTQSSDGLSQGIEIRQGQVSIEAVSRQATSSTQFVSGWQQHFDSVNTQLMLPPGWSLLASSGVDSVYHSWLSRWDLMDIFFVLIVVAACYRLCGTKTALVALASLLILYHRDNAPLYIWLNIVAILALLKVSEGKLKQYLNYYQSISFVILALILIPFAVDEVRQAIYPQLELKYHVIAEQGQSDLDHQEQEKQRLIMERERRSAQKRSDDVELYSSAPSKLTKMAKRAFGNQEQDSAYSISAQNEYDPNAIVQTGPGVPQWTWTSINLSWSGPVAKGEQFELYLAPPWLNRLAHLLSVLLSVLFAYILLQKSQFITTLKQQTSRLQEKVQGSKSQTTKSQTTGSTLSCLCLFALASFSYSTDSYAQSQLNAHQNTANIDNNLLLTPSSTALNIDKSLLKELAIHLSKPAKCLPACASISQAKISSQGKMLTIDMTIDALDSLAVNLPASYQSWLPETVLHNNQAPVLQFHHNKQLFIQLSKGKHHIKLQGLIHRENIELNFAMPVHNLSTDLKGWDISGVKKGYVATGSIQIKRIPKIDEQQDTLLPSSIPPYLIVTRTLKLGLEWSVLTEVKRLAPSQGAISLKIPLLEGESPIQEFEQDKDGITVVFAANQQRLAWRSILKKQDKITLQAPAHFNWAEIWQLESSPMWHLEFSGLEQIKTQNYQHHSPIWQPWPSESVSISINKPKAVTGNSITIDSVSLDHQLGARSNLSKLSLKIRSSQGQNLPFTLPDDVSLESLLIDGQSQALNLSSSTLSLPLHPGEQTIELNWRSDKGIQLYSETPKIDLVQEASNIRINVQLPEKRWLLFVGGPTIGPAILLWGMLLVIAVIAIALGKTKQTPLKWHHWLLLGLGIASTNLFATMLVPLWLFALAYRGKLKFAISANSFQLVQIILILLSIITLATILISIPVGLLSSPDMHIIGNGSYASNLRWYQDRALTELPQAWVISLPLYIYRIAMLAWSLWLALVILDWLKWAWQQLNYNGFWDDYAYAIKLPKAQSTNKAKTKTPVKPKAEDALTKQEQDLKAKKPD